MDSSQAFPCQSWTSLLPENCIFLLTSQNLFWSLLTSFVNHFYLPNFWTTITWRQVREDAANNSGRAPVTQDSNQILLHTPDTQIFPSSGLLCPIDAGRPILLCKILNLGAGVEPLDPAPLSLPEHLHLVTYDNVAVQSLLLTAAITEDRPKINESSESDLC